MGKQLITTVVNERGEVVSVDLGLGGEPKSTPNYNLYDKLPPGEYVGSIDLGELRIYRQPDGTLMRCRHFRPCFTF